MNRRSGIILAVIFCGLLVALWLIGSFKPTRAPTISFAQSASAPAVNVDQASVPTQIPRANPHSNTLPFQTPSVPWHDKLSALQARTDELFGATGEDRIKELQTFAESIPTTELPAAVAELQKLQIQNPTIFGSDLQRRLLRQWAENDAQPAADWVMTMPAGAGRQEALAAITGMWARQKFSDAKTWASQLRDPVERQKALAAIVEAATYTNPVESLKLATTLPADANRDSMIAQAAGAWADSAPADAIAWAKQIPDQSLREQVVSVTATTWADKNPVAAGDLAINSLSPGPVQDRTLIGVLQRWAFTDPAAAKAWVNRFPNGELRDTALATLKNMDERIHR